MAVSCTLWIWCFHLMLAALHLQYRRGGQWRWLLVDGLLWAPGAGIGDETVASVWGTVGCLDCLSGAETADMMTPVHVHLTTVVFEVIQVCSLFLFFLFFPPKFVKDLCYSLKRFDGICTINHLSLDFFSLGKCQALIFCSIDCPACILLCSEPAHRELVQSLLKTSVKNAASLGWLWGPWWACSTGETWDSEQLTGLHMENWGAWMVAHENGSPGPLPGEGTSVWKTWSSSGNTIVCIFI